MKLRWVAALTLLHAVISAAAISPLFFYLDVGDGAARLRRIERRIRLLEDVRAYHDYASRIVEGQIPYRDFAIEYPMGAIHSSSCRVLWRHRSRSTAGSSRPR